MHVSDRTTTTYSLIRFNVLRSLDPKLSDIHAGSNYTDKIRLMSRRINLFLGFKRQKFFFSTVRIGLIFRT